MRSKRTLSTIGVEGHIASRGEHTPTGLTHSGLVFPPLVEHRALVTQMTHPWGITKPQP